MTPEQVTRFWSHVDKSAGPHACWIWTGAKLPKGYGRLMLSTNGERRVHLAHRVAYEITHGPIEPDKEVCHSCDVRPCCQPEHLFQGTHADNIADCVAKQRTARGERNGGAKLTAEQVKAIQTHWASGDITKKGLGRAYQVNEATIRRILNGKTWAHI